MPSLGGWACLDNEWFIVKPWSCSSVPPILSTTPSHTTSTLTLTLSRTVQPMQYLTKHCFTSAEFASLDGFSLRPMMKVRKIFTLPSELFVGEVVTIPSNLQFPKGTKFQNYIFGQLSIAQYLEMNQMAKKITINAKPVDKDNNKRKPGK